MITLTLASRNADKTLITTHPAKSPDLAGLLSLHPISRQRVTPTSTL